MEQTPISTKTLVISTLSAIVLAALALITLVLPAEYDIDPTGIGQKLGLTALAPNSSISSQAKPAKEATTDPSDKRFQIQLSPGQGLEFKVNMAQYAKLKYQWSTTGAPLFFDLHGEPQGDTTGYFESYAIGTAEQFEGSFTSPFAGTHGWYWENKSEESVEVNLRIKGDYQEINH